jgi:AAA domain
MKFFLNHLVVGCKREREEITFTDFNYFYGQMGSGKSTIARLIDFCLGGTLELTPALQSEFVYATLTIEIEGRSVLIRREVDASSVTATYTDEDGDVVLNLPSRKPEGVVLPGTNVEVLSDLVFMLAGRAPPMVRRSKLNEDSDLSRLSIRDLLWFCHLDQDTIDSDFFHLGADANTFKRLKSRDVLRFIVGFHQENVSELENQLEEIRLSRMAYESAASSMAKAMTAANIATSLELEATRRQLMTEEARVAEEISKIRLEKSSLRPHGIETLQAEGRILSDQISEANRAFDELKQERAKHVTHKNELTALSARWLRSRTASTIIRGVEFIKCPSCTQALPERTEGDCPVCGQNITDSDSVIDNAVVVNRDLQGRISELEDLIAQQDKELAYTSRHLSDLLAKKIRLDEAISNATEHYDSSYLSAALELERKRSAINQQIADLEKLEQLAGKITELQAQAEKLSGREATVRASLKSARAAAEHDTGNLTRLKELFLDCLVRSKIVGFLPSDVVEIRSPNFLPEVMSRDVGDLAVTSFANIGSGGKKTLFKCCFAVAVHRLVNEIGGLLPQLIIIDSPMKNISERENVEQFRGFHELLYDLAAGDLKGTQFILIDKEMLSPPPGFGVPFTARHMTPSNPDLPPLIKYYTGQ